MSERSPAPMQEVARRAFAREFNDATYTFLASDNDRAPVSALEMGDRSMVSPPETCP